MRSSHSVAAAALIVVGLSMAAWAQPNLSVTPGDIQRLQDNVYLAERDVAQLRGRDTARATQLQTELDDLRDEVVYLKVKLRKDKSLARNEYGDVRDRIEGLRSRARGDVASAAPSTGATATARAAAATTAARGTIEIPSGTELDVRLQNSLNSGTAQVEDRFEATTLADVPVGGRTAIPAGSVMRGVVTAVEPATRTNRTSSMTVSFDQVTIGGRPYPMRGTVTQAIQGEGLKGEIGRTGAGAAVGGLLGAVLGGAKGAVLGAVIGGGGTLAATEGKQVELPQGAVLRVRIDAPVQIGTPAAAR
jgi:hypothetical protein